MSANISLLWLREAWLKALAFVFPSIQEKKHAVLKY